MERKCFYLIILALVLLFSGCSQNSAKSTSSEQNQLKNDVKLPAKNNSSEQKGRYVEKALSLPDGISRDQALTLTKMNGMPFLFAMKENPNSIMGYQLGDDGSWSEATPKWLQTLKFPNGFSYEPCFMTDEKGYQYFFYYELLEDSLKGNLVRSVDGTTYEILHPEGWEDKDTQGYYPMPAKVAILEDGSLVTLFHNGNVTTYDNENYKKQDSITNEDYSEFFLTAMGEAFVLGKAGEGRKLTGVDIYHKETPDQPVSYPYSTSIGSYNYCDVTGNDLFLCNADGVHKLQSETSIWNTVVDGTLTSLAMPTMYLSGFIAASDQFYILFGSDSEYKLMNYVYDENVNMLPSSQLTIYSLKDNSTLRQAAAIFQQAHPDVKVDFSVAMTDTEYASGDASIREDYIRALNTKLLAGDSYDILVLDGLPADSFIEKGILMNISDLLKPLLDRKELPASILEDYFVDEKIYCVPARFSLNLLYGTDAAIKNLTTLEELSEYTTAHPDDILLGKLSLEEFIDIFAPYLEGRIRNADGSMNREGLIAALKSLKPLADCCGVMESNVTDAPHGNGPWNLEQASSMCLNPCAGFLDGIFPFGMVARVKGAYVSFENSYTPSTVIGIASGSKQKELSKEFLQLVLSEDIQKNDLYDGFPINTKALLTCAETDHSNYGMTISSSGDGGKDEPISISAQTKEQIDDILSFISTVTKQAVCDEHITDALKKKTSLYFSGAATPEETADAIIEGLKVYLKE